MCPSLFTRLRKRVVWRPEVKNCRWICSKGFWYHACGLRRLCELEENRDLSQYWCYWGANLEDITRYPGNILDSKLSHWVCMSKVWRMAGPIPWKCWLFGLLCYQGAPVAGRTQNACSHLSLKMVVRMQLLNLIVRWWARLGNWACSKDTDSVKLFNSEPDHKLLTNNLMIRVMWWFLDLYWQSCEVLRPGFPVPAFWHCWLRCNTFPELILPEVVLDSYSL